MRLKNCLVVLTLLASSFATARAAGIPVTVAEYDALKDEDLRTFQPQTVRSVNLQRVLDVDLPVPQRIESLNLVIKMAGAEPDVLDLMAGVLSEGRNPPEIQKAVLDFLIKSNRPGLAAYAIKALPGVKPSPLRETILAWLAQHGDGAMLVDIIKVWDQEKPGSSDESQFRSVVEKIGGASWDQVLLNCINGETFHARGSAMEILASRTTPAALRSQLVRMQPKTEAMAALQASIADLDYLPPDGASLLTAVTVFRTRPDVFKDAARLSRQWQNQYGYQFNIRDVHLLSRLSGDPLRQMLRRNEIVTELTAAFSKRAQVPSQVPEGAAADFTDSFAKQADHLTMCDLWNLYLLNQMMGRWRVLLSLRVMSEQDRADTRTAWGGLIVYENGQAEARLYPPDIRDDDLRYYPGRQMLLDGRDAMCRFHGHFEKAANAGRAGPTAAELRDAKVGNFYGLVLTSVSDTELCAHYYNPQGQVVSIGKFGFGK